MNNSTARFNETCSNCVHHQKELAELKKALDEARDEFSYQYRQHEDQISSMVENLPSYRRWLDAKARLDALSAKYSPRNQNVKNVLEEVRQPDSNTLRAPNSLTVTNKKYDTKYELVEDRDKSFHRDSKRSHSA